ASVSSRRIITASPKLTLTIKFLKKVLKWGSGYISPSFTLRGSDKCWMRILNARVPTHIPAKLQIEEFTFPTSSSDLRYRGYSRNFSGAGHKKDLEFGFSQWERDH
ncbi:hypothetical protein PHMEG_00018852, partial [Phytophthora megakarya]